MPLPGKKYKPKRHVINRTAAQPAPMPASSLDRARRLSYAAIVLDEVKETPGHAKPPSKPDDEAERQRVRAEATRHARLLLHYTQN